MLSLKVFVVVLPLLLYGAMTIEIPSENDTAEFLWRLYGVALQSRIAHKQYPYPYFYKYPGKYPEYYQNYLTKPYSQYPSSTYAPSYINKPYPYKLHKQNPFTYKPSHFNSPLSTPNDFGTYSDALQNFQHPKESLMDVLYSVARNDDLQCVPKLICEVTSGTISGRQGLNLPLNVNMESLLGFVSSLNSAQMSPLLHFGKAALLGFTSKGNTGNCNYAYPECPSDPDKVVKYLNNHNGGFFRFFNGVAQQNYPQTYHQVPRWKKKFADQRIQNNAVEYVPNNRYQNGITFPTEENVDSDFEYPHSFRSEKTLKFPNSDVISTNELNQDTDHLYSSHADLRFPTDDNYKYPVRNPKELFYNYFSSGDEIDLQRPLPNHKASPMIFPVRTGTGNLRLDPEELLDYNRPVYYQDDDVKVVFNGVSNEDISYVRKGRGFSFPQ